MPEASGPMIELANGSFGPAPAGSQAHIDPPLDPAVRDAQNSPAAIEARRAETERKAQNAADRVRRGF
jgi:hypothetical protein